MKTLWSRLHNKLQEHLAKVLKHYSAATHYILWIEGVYDCTDVDLSFNSDFSINADHLAKLPFRIKPSTPSVSVTLSDTDNVGALTILQKIPNLTTLSLQKSRGFLSS
jgi:hypothetical protein